IASKDLVGELRDIEDSPWAEFDYNASKLAYRLREFGIRPGRNTTGSKRGYALEWFEDAFGRYTRQDPSDPSETGDEQEQSSDGSEASDGSGCQTESTRQTEIPGQQAFLTGLTPFDDPTAGNGQIRYCDCGNELAYPESIRRGTCTECFLSSKP